MTDFSRLTVAIIGAGPAGLMAAEVLATAGVQVDVYDAMPSVGRKFLLAGRGGLNLTHAEPYADFVSRYGSRQVPLQSALDAFTPQALRDWAQGLGVDTFVGSSRRVFPVEMKAAPLLRAWLHRLRTVGVRIHVRHRWLGWGTDNQVLCFATGDGERQVQADAVLLALGGGSWPRFGSTGAWVDILLQRGIASAPLRPANCGFDVAWGEYFRQRYAGQPLKNISLSLIDSHGQPSERRGECIITRDGVEGGVIYALSAALRDVIEAHGTVEIQLDLSPDKSLERLCSDLARKRGKMSFSNHLRKRAAIDGVKAGLVREYVDHEILKSPPQLAAAIKALPLRLVAPRPLAEAISTAGGVPFEVLDEGLMLKTIPGVFCAGEMLDWEAPTGGYLLTACFATGRAAGQGLVKWLGKSANLERAVSTQD
jgi:hypothetical protein